MQEFYYTPEEIKLATYRWSFVFGRENAGNYFIARKKQYADLMAVKPAVESLGEHYEVDSGLRDSWLMFGKSPLYWGVGCLMVFAVLYTMVFFVFIWPLIVVFMVVLYIVTSHAQRGSGILKDRRVVFINFSDQVKNLKEPIMVSRIIDEFRDPKDGIAKLFTPGFTYPAKEADYLDWVAAGRPSEVHVVENDFQMLDEMGREYTVEEVLSVFSRIDYTSMSMLGGGNF